MPKAAIDKNGYALSWEYKIWLSKDQFAAAPASYFVRAKYSNQLQLCG
jgi:hypothetical protein